jgi:hypothetical protein
MKTMIRICRFARHQVIRVAALWFISSVGAHAATWPTHQRDGANTGRADFSVPMERMNSNFFKSICWQQPAPESPYDGGIGASAMVFFDSTEPDGKDLVVGGYHWPKGIQAMDRHTGKLAWFGNPGGGEVVGDVTPAFSPDGLAIYTINDDTTGALMAVSAKLGPGHPWNNSGDTHPEFFLGAGLKVAADGRIFGNHCESPVYAATNRGDRLSLVWTAATSPCACLGHAALWQGPEGLRVISGGRCGLIGAWNGVTGQELWMRDVPSGTDAGATIDPANGRIYLPLGFDNIWIAGLDKDGTPLWDESARPVFTWEDGVDEPQRAGSTGCLAADGATFYFQTITDQGSGKLYAIRTSDGSVKWSVATGSGGTDERNSSPIVTSNSIVLVGNNSGGTYFAILDAETNGVVLATLPVLDGASARSSFTLSPDGLLYLPARLLWTRSNGDSNAPTFEPANLFMAFDLTKDAQTPLVEGELHVDMQATDPSAGSPVWLNHGSLGNFTRHGSPEYVSDVAGTGVPGVFFDGEESYYSGPVSVPDLEDRSDRSIEVWVLNPEIADEETMVSWGHRDGPDGSNFAINYGSSTYYGAAGHWGWDLGWEEENRVPLSNVWHHIVYTYNGGTRFRVYVDGVERVRVDELGPLCTHSGNTVLVGAQNGWDESPVFLLSGYLNTVRVYGGVLTSNLVAEKFAAGPARVESGLYLDVVSAHGEPSPALGRHFYTNGSIVACQMPQTLVTESNAQYVCTGWMVSGDISNGLGSAFTFKITRPSSLTWVWSPVRYRLNVAVEGNGEIERTGEWALPGSTETVAAIAEQGWRFDHWSGETNGCTIDGARIQVVMDAGRSITASFTEHALPWLQVALPDTAWRSRHTALGSDGTNIFFTRGAQASPPFYRLPRGSSAGSDWQTLTPLPVPVSPDINSGIGDLSCFDGALWTFARRSASTAARGVYRYDVAANSWSMGGATTWDGPNAACAVLAGDRVLGGVIGADRVYSYSAWQAGTCAQVGTLPGGASHPWAACVGNDFAYFIKHRNAPRTNGVLVKINRTGSIQIQELPAPPFNPGMGCALEYLPGHLFHDGHERLWVLRGGAGAGENDGASWTEPVTTNNVAVYDLSEQFWTIGTTGFPTDEGSEACLAGNLLYVLAANGVENPLRFLDLTNTLAPCFYTLHVQSSHGSVFPPAGRQDVLIGHRVICEAPTTVETEGAEYQCVGWTGSGSVRPGTGNKAQLIISENSELTWQWNLTRYRLIVTQEGSGSTDISSALIAAETRRTLTASPAPDWEFTSWSGDTNGCSFFENTATILMDQPRRVVAHFSRKTPVLNATYFVSPAGSHVPPFNSWATAATNLSAALDVAADGTTVLVTNGTYRLSTEILVNKPVKLISVNGPGDTILDGANQTRCLRIAHSNAVVDGFTLTRGWTTNSGGGVFINQGTLQHSVVLSNTSALGSGGGIFATQSCLVQYCRIEGNSATNGTGGGFSEATIERGSMLIRNCEVRGNLAKRGGGIGASTMLELRNLLVIGNRALENSGGVFAYRIRMVNSTVVENQANSSGGMHVAWTSGATLVNCIIDKNHDDNGAKSNLYLVSSSAGTVRTTFTDPPQDNFIIVPDYSDPDAGDYHLRPRSPGIDQGTQEEWMTETVDLDGTPRLAGERVDLGPWEYSGNRFSCDLARISYDTMINEPLVLEAAVFGANTNGLFFAWDLDDDGVFEHAGAHLSEITNSYPNAGTYAISLYVSNSAGQVATIRRERGVEAGVPEIFVSASGGAWPPYTNWLLAARSLHEALPSARAGSVIWIASGVYTLTNEACLNYGITLQSIEGPAQTQISGSGSNRCFYIGHSNAIIRGLTIKDGYELASDGGGVYIKAGTLSDCIVADSESESFFTTAEDVGGWGGGVFMETGLIERCVITNNTGECGGVVIKNGCVEGSKICNNNGYQSGGIMLYGGLLRNSLITGNVSPQAPRGQILLNAAAGVSLTYRSGSRMESCTVAYNTLTTRPWGGLEAPAVDNKGEIVNSIITSNICPAQLRTDSSASNFFTCCSDEITGPGCFQADPRFVDGANGDFRLRGDSPCLNAGMNQPWMTGAPDLRGQPRITDYQVDLGAYEYDPGQLTFAWTPPISTWLHGVPTLSWETLTGRTQAMSIQLSLSGLGGKVVLAKGLPLTGSFPFDSTQIANGQYELRAILNADNAALLESSRTVFVNNSALPHSGTVSASETWSNNLPHIVEGSFVIAAGQVLTLSPGTIVKVAPGAKIVIENGAKIQAAGTMDAPVIFTSWADDSAGGDANGDGTLSLPQPGDWLGFELQGSGSLDFNTFVETRYLLFRHQGQLSANETWSGQSLHWVTDDLTVPAGKAVTIGAGAIIKLNPAKAITVKAGGSIVAEGTGTLPITITSINDDSVAGDSAKDGSATVPTPGDWAGLHIEGTARLAHTKLRYGAGGEEASLPAMIRITTIAANVVLDSCRLADALHDAISTWGGTTLLTNSVLANNGRGILVRENSTAVMVNCTLDRHNWGVVAHDGILRVFNSIIANSAEYGVFGTPTEFAYNDVWSTTSGGYLTGVQGNISKDPAFRGAENGNYQLGYLSPAIDAADSTLAPVTDAANAPRYDDPRTPNTGQGTGPVADMGAYEFAEQASSDLDLIVLNVSGPENVTAGEMATVTWQIKNIGSETFNGQWQDTIYLVPDVSDGWTESIQAGESSSTGTLGPQGTVTCSARVRVPGGTEGIWRWQIKANSDGKVFEGENWNNNLSSASAPCSMNVQPVSSTGLTGMFPGANQPVWCRVGPNDSGGVRLLIDSAFSPGRVRIYAALGRMPTEEHFDFRSAQTNSPDVVLALPGSTGQDTYIMIVPEQLPFAPAAFKLTEESHDFGIASITPPVAGNESPATFRLEGFGFTPELQVELIPAQSGLAIAAGEIAQENSTLAYARVNLAGALPGLYHLRLEDGAAQATLSNAVQIVAATAGLSAKGEFRAHLSLPSAVRAGRIFKGYVHYENAGKGDVPAPLLVLGADDKTRIYPLGNPEQAGAQLHFLACAQDTPMPSILAPGSHYTYVFQGVSLGNDPISVRLYQAGTELTNVMNYASLKADILPEYPHPLFESAYARLTNSLGTRLGDYISSLGHAAERAAQSGLTGFTEQELLTYLLRESVEQVQEAAVSGCVFIGTTNQTLGRVQVVLTPDNSSDTNLYATTSWYDGTFGIRDVPPGSYWISLAGYLPSPIAHVSVPESSHRVFGLMLIASGAAAEISGKITGQGSGIPIADATVVARGAYNLFVGFGATDTNGTYFIQGLPAGLYTLEVSAPGTHPQPLCSVSTSAGKTTYRSFVLSRAGGTIRGVVRSATGIAMPGALVTAEWLDYTPNFGDWRQASTHSEDDGTFQLSALPTGRFSVAASSRTAGVSAATTISLSADGGTPQEVELVLQGNVAISGIIRDAASGAPLKGARVAVSTTPEFSGTFLTDANGQFLIPHLPAGSWQLNAAAEGYVLGKTNVSTPTSGSYSVQLALCPRGELSLQVRNGGTPLETAVATLLPWGSDNVQYLVTDQNGEAGVAGIPPGEYDLVAGSVGGLSYGRQHITVSPATPTHNLTLDLSLSRIHGTIVAAGTTNGLEGVEIFLAQAGEILASTTTDPLGTYSFALFAPGEYQVIPAGTNCVCPPALVTVGSGATLKVQTLEQPASNYTVQVRDNSSGIALSNAWVELRPVSIEDRRFSAPLLLTGPSGEAKFTGVFPGNYRLWIHGNEHALWQENVQITTGSLTNTIGLIAGRRIQGHIQHAGTAVPWTYVGLTDTNGNVLIATLTDTNGHYAISTIPPGVFDLIVRPVGLPDCPPIVRSGLDMASSTDRTEDFVLSATSQITITGSVTDAAGHKVTSANVLLLHGSNAIVVATTTDAQGRFRLSPCPAGQFRLRAEALGYRSTTSVIELTSGVQPSESELAISLPLSAAGAVANHEKIGAKTKGKRSSGITGFIDSFLDLYTDQNWGDLATSGFWSDVLGGSMGLVDPQLPFENSNIDLEKDLNEPYQAAKASGKADCALQAFEEGLARFKNLNSALAGWNGSFQAAKKLNRADVELVISRGGLVAAKTAKLALTLSSPTTKGLTPDMQDSIVGAADNACGWIGACSQGAASGDFDELGALFQGGNSVGSFGNLAADGLKCASFNKLQGICKELGDINRALKSGQGTLPPDYLNRIAVLKSARLEMYNDIASGNKIRGLSDPLGKVTSGLDIINEIKDLWKSVQDMDQDVVEGANRYLIAQDTYSRAMLDYHKARKKLQALAKDCKQSDGTKAENPDYDTGDKVDEAEAEKPFELDPNDKITTGVGPHGAIQALDRIFYTIHFENVSTASAPAQLVVVTDRLHPGLDENTFELGEIAFNGVTVWPGPGLSIFEGQANVSTDPNPVRIQARLNPETRTATWTLQSVDVVTGDYPEDPWSGFLPPNTTNHIGEGYVSFSILPKAGTGDTLITNQGVIVFGVNPAIATPVVSNMVDRVTPSSSVNALPALSPTTSFTVSWSGSDSGAGISDFDVFVSINHGPWAPWLANTTLGSAVFNGQLKTTYSFYSIARDAVGHVEPAPETADATTTTTDNQPPVLASISNRLVRVNSSMAITNQASDPDGHTLRFSLGQHPAGASITTDSGVVRWTPTCSQGSSTNLFEVVVTDSGTPPLSATQTFLAFVPECIEASLGTTVMQTGTTSSVPVHLLSTVALTNLTFTIVYPPDRLTNLQISLKSPQVLTQHSRLITQGSLEVSFTLPASSVLHGPTNVAELFFNALSNQNSAFVSLPIDDVEGWEPQGSMAANAHGQPGRVVVIGREPLLEGYCSSNGIPHVLLYGNPGVTYTLEQRTNLSLGTWQEIGSVSMTNLVRDAHTGVPGTRFIRAH